MYLPSHCLTYCPLSVYSLTYISNISLSSRAALSICFSPIFSPPHWPPLSAHCLPPSLLSPLPPFPRPLSLSLSFPLRTISMPLCAQGRSALITLMAMMIQLNGALLPPVPLQGHSAASSSYQQHSARNQGLGSVASRTRRQDRWTHLLLSLVTC